MESPLSQNLGAHWDHEPMGGSAWRRPHYSWDRDTRSLPRFMESKVRGLRPVCEHNNFRQKSTVKGSKKPIIQHVAIEVYACELLRSPDGLAITHGDFEPYRSAGALTRSGTEPDGSHGVFRGGLAFLRPQRTGASAVRIGARVPSPAAAVKRKRATKYFGAAWRFCGRCGRGRPRSGTWRAPFRFCACIGTLNLGCHRCGPKAPINRTHSKRFAQCGSGG